MTNTNQNVEHDIITHDAHSVSWAEIWEFSKSQRDIYWRDIALATCSRSQPILNTNIEGTFEVVL